MLIDIAKLLLFSDKKEVFDISKTFYQQKLGSLLFAAITIRPNISFAVSRLLQFNQRQRIIYYEVADWIFHYLLGTQNYYICYRGEIQDISFFVYASDLSFTDRSLDGRVLRTIWWRYLVVQLHRKQSSKTQSPLFIKKRNCL